MKQLFTLIILFLGSASLLAQDSCDAPQVAGSFENGMLNIPFDFEGASSSMFAPVSACGFSGELQLDDLWFSFVAEAERHVMEIEFNDGSVTNLSWRALLNDCDGEEVFCNNDGNGYVLNLVVGETYLLRSVKPTINNSSGIITIRTVQASLIDDCSTALDLGVVSTESTSMRISSIGATDSNTETNSFCNTFGERDDEVWFSFRSEVDDLLINFDITDNSPPVNFGGLFFQLFEDECADMMTSFECEDNNGLRVSLSAGTEYLGRVFTRNQQYFEANLRLLPILDIANGTCSEPLDIGIIPETDTVLIPDQHNYLTDLSEVEFTADCFFGIGIPVGDIWLSFTASGDRTFIDFDNLGGQDDVIWDVLAPECQPVIESVFCSDNENGGEFETIAGQDYLLRVFTFSNSSDGFYTDIRIGNALPVNTSCATSRDIFCGETLTNQAMQDGSDTSNCNLDLGTWYRFVGGDENVNVLVRGEIGSDPELAVVTGNNCSGFNTIACVDDSGGRLEDVNFLAESGQEYYVIVSEFFGDDEVFFDLEIECTPSTSVSDLSLVDKYILHPNPAHDRLFLTAPSAELSNIALTILTINGQVVNNAVSYKESAKVIEVELGSLQQGMYTLIITSSEGKTAKKFVVY